MTSKVTVDAHAGLDIEVVTVRGEYTIDGKWINPLETIKEKVLAGTKKDFYIHSGMTIQSIREL